MALLLKGKKSKFISEIEHLGGSQYVCKKSDAPIQTHRLVENGKHGQKTSIN